MRIWPRSARSTPSPAAAGSGAPTRPLIVITGASAGIGEAIARRLGADGARLVVLARRAERLKPLVQDLGAVAYPVDLSDPQATAEVCRRILEEVGVPDAVINNAGSGRFQSIEETSAEEARAQMDLPYFAAFHVTRGLVGPMMARGSGVIFQINSPVAVIPWPGAVGYAAARWAIRGFTEALRQDLHGTGVLVGSLTPTRVHSDYFTANPDSLDRVPKAEVVVGTMTPAQVADAVADALRRRPGRDSYAPWRWRLLAPLAKAVPGPFVWLFRVTGRRRRGRGRP